MPTLDYQTQLPPTRDQKDAAFWRMFGISGVAGVVLGARAFMWWNHPVGDGFVFIVAAGCLAVVYMLLILVRFAMPKRTRSPLVAVAFGLLGPLAGLLVLDLV